MIIRPSTDNSMNEEGEGGRPGGDAAVHIVYPHKDLFKHLSKNKCGCVSGWTKRCVCHIHCWGLVLIISPTYVKQQWCLNSSSCTCVADGTEVQHINLLLQMRLFESHMPWLIIYLGDLNMICLHFCKSKEMYHMSKDEKDFTLQMFFFSFLIFFKLQMKPIQATFTQGFFVLCNF